VQQNIFLRTRKYKIIKYFKTIVFPTLVTVQLMTQQRTIKGAEMKLPAEISGTIHVHYRETTNTVYHGNKTRSNPATTMQLQAVKPVGFKHHKIMEFLKNI
jgi:ribosomal protein L6P/L9E